jgi:hypothetical protein
MSSEKRNPNIKINWPTIILIVSVVIVIGLMVYIYLQNRAQNNPQNSPEPSGTMEATPESSIVLPKALLDIDQTRYELKGVYLAQEASSKNQAWPKVPMGDGSKIQLSFDNEPESNKITLYRDQEVVFTNEALSVSPEDIPADGEYRAVCEAKWETDEFTGTVNYNFIISAEFPPKIEISATETLPGELIVLKIKYLNDDEEVKLETNLDFTPNVFKYNDDYVILLPVSYYNKDNEVYSFKVIIGEDEFKYDIAINEKEFVVQQLTIDPKIAAETRNDKSAQEVQEKIAPLRPVCDETAHWEGGFIMPVEGGRVREYDFGKRRHVNGSPTSYRHNGLDIGHDLGVPVMASNTGRVLIADYMIGTGNTVIIEHGFGLKTWYYHMDELFVKTGDMVNKGEVIGTVGSTGFSTGPHLHFSSSINNVYINPITLINEGIPLLTKAEKTAFEAD